MFRNFRRYMLLSSSALLILSLAGCGGSQVTHYSAQLGRFCGDGVSFTVPMIERAKELQAEDRFWELRQGIGNTVVIVLAESENTSGTQTFRSNMALTKTDFNEKVLNAEQFCREQCSELKNEGSCRNISEGLDEFAPWVSFEQDKNGLPISCKAWFFTDGGHGYVLLGSAWSGSKDLQKTMADFKDVASTFEIGSGKSGFVKHGEVLSKAVSVLTEESAAEASEAPKAQEADSEVKSESAD